MLNTLGVWEEFTYACPFSANEYYWFLPTYIATNDYSPYKEALKRTRKIHVDGEHCMGEGPIAFDSGFQKWSVEGQDTMVEGMSGVERALLGHGFTTYTLPSDGHGDIVDAYLELENGDKIAGLLWEWYNK